MQRKLKLDIGGRTYDLQWGGTDGTITLAGTVDGKDLPKVSLQASDVGDTVTIVKDGRSYPCAVVRQSDGIWASLRGRSYFAQYARTGAGVPSGPNSDEIRAPMTGTLLEVNVTVGDPVAAGQVLAIMEAMKMEYRLEAEMAGTVARVDCKIGEQVDVGTLLIKLDSDPA